MIGLKRTRRWAQLLAAFMVAIIGVATLAQPARAADTGTIEGGVFIVDVKGTKVKITDKNSKITLSPTADGAQTSINDGKIRITNVPVGTYNVALDFKFTKDVCDNKLGIIGSVISAPIALFCKSDIKDSYYSFRKAWTVTVTNGQTVFLEGTSSSGDKNIGTAIQTTANGNPIVDCAGKGMLMSFAVCPMIENILGVMDWVIEEFIQPYLAINPLTTTDEAGAESQLYTIWNNIRNFANVVFIGLFFVIVFSQATSVGISNYGIKRLLPRLVLIAIGTNVSFFICAFLIDVFNVLGAGIASLLMSTIIDGQPKITVGSDLFDTLFAAGPTGMMASLLGQGVLSAAIIFGLFIFLIIGAAIMFVAAVVILLRQIAIIFFIIISPLAFIAGLLPNTQKYFSQWFSAFARLLAMYPILMVLFASGKIASTVLQKIGQ